MNEAQNVLFHGCCHNTRTGPCTHTHTPHTHVETWKCGGVTDPCLLLPLTPCHIRLHAGVHRLTPTCYRGFWHKTQHQFWTHFTMLCSTPSQITRERSVCIRIPVHCFKNAGHQELKGIETQTSFALNVNIIPLQITIHALFLLRFKGKKNSDYSFQAYIFKFV